ncbi:hypothetical protein ABPG74_020027 [Tetrahymena malaccensis]
MKIITFAILALLALSFVKTDQRSDYLQCRNDNPKINFTCDMDLEDYDACDQVYQAVSDCITDCKFEDTFKERAVCIEKKCKSSRKDVQIMIDLELKCNNQVAGVKPVPKPEPKPEPQPQPEPQPEPKPEPQPQPQPENKPDTQPENKPNTKPDNKESENTKPNGNLREEKASNASNQSLSAIYLIYSLGLIILTILY